MNENKDLYEEYYDRAKKLRSFIDEFNDSLLIDFVPELDEARNQALDSIVTDTKSALTALGRVSDGFELLESGEDISEYIF